MELPAAPGSARLSILYQKSISKTISYRVNCEPCVSATLETLQLAASTHRSPNKPPLLSISPHTLEPSPRPAAPECDDSEQVSPPDSDLQMYDTVNACVSTFPAVFVCHGAANFCSVEVSALFYSKKRNFLTAYKRKSCFLVFVLTLKALLNSIFGCCTLKGL